MRREGVRQVSRKKWLLIMRGTVAAFLASASAGFADPEIWPWILVFSALTGVVAVRDFHEAWVGPPWLRLNDEGLWSRRHGTVWWDDVETTGVFETTNVTGIGFRLREGHRSLTDAGFLGRLNSFYAQRFYGYPVIVSVRELEISLEDFKAEVGRHVLVVGPG